MVAGLIVFYTVKENAVATIVSLFSIIAGSIMAGIGLIALLIVVLLIFLSRPKKREPEDEQQAEAQPEIEE